MEDKISNIALETLNIETLETRRIDHLDFYNLPVWEIKRALELAYLAGKHEGLQLAKELI